MSLLTYSLLPLLMSDPFSYRPSRLLDQQFAQELTPEDLISAVIDPKCSMFNRGLYYRPWRSGLSAKDVGSTISESDGKFLINLDVQQFKPEEISVTTNDKDTITVEGKHEEKQDEHGSISRHFVRKYILPKQFNIQELSSELSSDGVLTISAPKLEKELTDERKISITQTGKPSRPAEIDNQKSNENSTEEPPK
ncbi:protein lethal(2)essential for life-like [Agrilus planipennis]|uniref:Protein lethal(2)essential for life-like n=1 Tax=Agrilus planipennis TaxID=224129 RepID=A0A1W4WM49_AGRPL|nr:protein lethal(2)essential for life-like [Agrilus planipennis]